MKGFKDPQGTFHPTKNDSGVRKKGGKSIIPSGIKLPSLRKQRETDSGEIPPNEIYDESQLIKYNGRYFRVREEMGGSLAVDEYQKINDDMFKQKKNIIFTQGGEETNNLLDVTGGAKKTEYGYELVDEMKFLQGLDGTGVMDD